MKNVGSDKVQAGTYQWAILEGIEHFKVPAALAPIKVSHMLPEAIHGSQVQQPLRVYFPCIPYQKKKKKRVNYIRKIVFQKK